MLKPGKASPNTRNPEFVQQCEWALPPGVRAKALRVDAAGYQGALIRHCDKHGLDYAIRAWLRARSIPSRDELLCTTETASDERSVTPPGGQPDGVNQMAKDHFGKCPLGTRPRSGSPAGKNHKDRITWKLE